MSTTTNVGLELLQYNARALTKLLRERQISAAQLLEVTLERAEHIRGPLNPFTLTLYDKAREAAFNADKALARGEGGTLCGLPVSIKDSQWYAGWPCTNGSAALLDFVPDETCQAVRNLESAGAVVFAKTTCPEFSLLGVTDSAHFGLSRNPWNPQHTCGGSSGGAAIAVAAGAGTLSLGGDGGGSIRIPAGFCGVVGFKPSFGRIDREPGFPTWKSLVAYGPLARCVDDARLMYEVLTHATPKSGSKSRVLAATSLADTKLLCSEDLGFIALDHDMRDHFRDLMSRLRHAGAELADDHAGLPSSVEVWGVIARRDTYQYIKRARYDLELLGPTTHQVLEFGSQFSAADHRAAEQKRKDITQAYEAMFKRTGAAAIVTPTLGCEAFPHANGYPESIGGREVQLPWLDWASFLYDANLTGMPACVVPIGLGDQGLPLSVQIMGPLGSDETVLRIAEQIEALAAWQHHCIGVSYA